MAVYELQIGADVGDLDYLEDLISSMCRTEFVRYPVEYVGLDGKRRGDGLPAATWTFDYISQADLTELRKLFIVDNVYVLSADGAITTRDDDGESGTYTCLMHWPVLKGKKLVGGFYRDVVFEFTQLVLQEEA